MKRGKKKKRQNKHTWSVEIEISEMTNEKKILQKLTPRGLNAILIIISVMISIIALGTIYDVLVWGWMLGDDYNILGIISALLSIIILSIIFKIVLKVKNGQCFKQ